MQNEKAFKIYSLSKRIVLIATMSALLIVGKLSLALLVPNIEVVTTLTIVFAFVFGYNAVAGTAIFCLVDLIIYPQTPSVIASYFIYWNLLAFICAFMSRRNIKSDTPYLICGLIMTIFFGILTSYMDSLLTNIIFWQRYVSGLLFFVMHFISTLVFMLVAFKPLSSALFRIRSKFFYVADLE